MVANCGGFSGSSGSPLADHALPSARQIVKMIALARVDAAKIWAQQAELRDDAFDVELLGEIPADLVVWAVLVIEDEAVDSLLL